MLEQAVLFMNNNEEQNNINSQINSNDDFSNKIERNDLNHVNMNYNNKLTKSNSEELSSANTSQTGKRNYVELDRNKTVNEEKQAIKKIL